MKLEMHLVVLKDGVGLVVSGEQKSLLQLWIVGRPTGSEEVIPTFHVHEAFKLQQEKHKTLVWSEVRTIFVPAAEDFVGIKREHDESLTFEVRGGLRLGARRPLD